MNEYKHSYSRGDSEVQVVRKGAYVLVKARGSDFAMTRAQAQTLSRALKEAAE